MPPPAKSKTLLPHAAQRALRIAFWLIVAALGLSRFLWLAADFPNYSQWMIDQAKFTDEGWWANAAVMHALTGHWHIAGDYNPAAALPIWPLLVSVLFHFTGVSIVAARALSVAISLATLVVIHVLVRRHAANPVAAQAAVVLMAASPFAFVFSRLAILDTLVVFEFCLMLLVASSTRPKIASGRSSSSPCMVTAALLTKTTVAVLYPPSSGSRSESPSAAAGSPFFAHWSPPPSRLLHCSSSGLCLFHGSATAPTTATFSTSTPCPTSTGRKPCIGSSELARQRLLDRPPSLSAGPHYPARLSGTFAAPLHPTDEDPSVGAPALAQSALRGLVAGDCRRGGLHLQPARRLRPALLPGDARARGLYRSAGLRRVAAPVAHRGRSSQRGHTRRRCPKLRLHRRLPGASAVPTLWRSKRDRLHCPH